MAGKTPSQGDRIKLLKERLKTDGGLGKTESADVIGLILSFTPPSRALHLRPAAPARFKSLKGFLDASEEEFFSAGLAGNAALFARLLKEASATYLKERMAGKDASQRPDYAIDYLRLSLSGQRVEKFAAIYLDGENRIVASELLHEGTINQTAVYPRKAIELALRHKASSMIFAHNHPSGDPMPSDADVKLAHALEDAARAVGLKVMSHVIIGHRAHVMKGRLPGL